MPCFASLGTWAPNHLLASSFIPSHRLWKYQIISRQRNVPARVSLKQNAQSVGVQDRTSYSTEVSLEVCTHSSEINRVQIRNLMVQLAAFGGFFSIQAFSQALAAPEIQQVSSLFSSIDDIKNGFALAFLLIFFSELGDKTFFIAAILATRKSNVAVFTGTFGALVAMTLISVTLGRAFHYIDGVLPFSLGNTEIPLDDLAAAVLLIYFGVSTLIDASSMEGSKADEEQQEAELAVAGVNGGSNTVGSVVFSTFALVFVAEWGDKSFFSTIALAAASSPIGVVAGAIAGHGAATLLAVLGGSFLGNYISEKVIAYIGGSLFLLFAGETLLQIFMK